MRARPERSLVRHCRALARRRRATVTPNRVAGELAGKTHAGNYFWRSPVNNVRGDGKWPFPGLFAPIEKKCRKMRKSLALRNRLWFCCAVASNKAPNQTKPNQKYDHVSPYRSAPSRAPLHRAPFNAARRSPFRRAGFFRPEQAQISPVLSQSRRSSIRLHRSLVLLLLNFPQITKPNQTTKMRAIVTKYHGPTNTRGSRIIARAEGVKPLPIPYPHELSGEACHRAAAVALCIRQGWPTELASGGLPDQSGYVFCFRDQ